MKRNTLINSLSALALGGALLVGCKDDASTGGSTPYQPQLANRSVTPALVKDVMSGVQVFTLISSDDQIPAPAGDNKQYVFGGAADGAGFLRNSDGTYTLLVEHEDNYAVSRLKLDKDLKPLTLDYVMTSSQGNWRQCSGTLAEPEEHGFGPTFLSGSEGFSGPGGNGNADSRIWAINPLGAKNTAKSLPALGVWSTENAVPLPKTAYNGKTVIIIGDDNTDQYGGQVALYVSNTVGDLDNGKLYVMARPNDDQIEMNMVKGQQYDVVFREIPGGLNLQGTDQAADAAKAIKFGRVEDLDYRKDGVGREIYFNVTGQAHSGQNANRHRTMWGRVYKLVLDPTDPLKGKLSVLLDGDMISAPVSQGGVVNQNRTTGPLETSFMNPDNILVTKNYVYVQEDPNSYNSGDPTINRHDAYIYQYNLQTGEMKLVLEMDHHRDGRPFVRTDGLSFSGAVNPGVAGSWEYGAMLDISDKIGVEGTFLLCVQPHGWRSGVFDDPDKDGDLPRPFGSATPDTQGSQVIILKGLAR
jgi:hypothetical protein